MITCYLRYTIDPYKIEEFTTYAKMWIPLVKEFGGTHHGYFMPHEGQSDIAVALFSFPNLAAYEEYRLSSAGHAGCQAAYAFAKETRCFFSYTRDFMTPVCD